MEPHAGKTTSKHQGAPGAQTAAPSSPQAGCATTTEFEFNCVAAFSTWQQDRAPLTNGQGSSPLGEKQIASSEPYSADEAEKEDEAEGPGEVE